jgi:hypothetical protein
LSLTKIFELKSSKPIFKPLPIVRVSASLLGTILQSPKVALEDGLKKAIAYFKKAIGHADFSLRP